MTVISMRCLCVLVVICMSGSIVLSVERPSHGENLLLKESVVRTNNGVMVMRLSPRQTVLSLKNEKFINSNGVVTGVDHYRDGDDGHGLNYGSKTRRHNAKPAIIFARTPSRKSTSTITSSSDSKDDDDDAPLENQTETETNPTDYSSAASSVQNHDESQQQFGSSEVNISADFDNENESRLSKSASFLRNTTGSVERSGGVNKRNKRPELGQVWSSKEDTSNKSTEENDLQTLIAGFLKREIWTIPLFVFASLNIVLITFFEIYVLCRTKGQSRGHLFLGQMLLFGLFLCSTLALFFAIYPSMMICFVFRIGIGLSYSLVFSVLMVKCMFLLCLDVGVYLPTMYQGSLLFFSVLVQIVLDTQWTMLFPPVFQETELIREDSVFLQCGTSYSLLLCSMWYIAFLVVLVGFLAAKATFRGIAENYRESIYILMSIIVTVPISVSWILAGWILEGREQDACVAFGLVAQSLTIFLIMFMPKGRQLAAMGKDGGYEEEDQFSRYSPSFFHFKPTNKSCKTAVFGDGNLYTTLEPTLSTINPNVFFHRADYHSGMIY
ncbi:uncharacterized protein LOC110851444 [Folsomia candida]|uniref:uncharacterized protein LOC110851444 n=1 Tax=Folsomia candida TaxID=158441 RepID=UPI001604C038|nr:uncharacterized protein LOC110851444 [Folsomia candida]